MTIKAPLIFAAALCLGLALNSADVSAQKKSTKTHKKVSAKKKSATAKKTTPKDPTVAVQAAVAPPAQTTAAVDPDDSIARTAEPDTIKPVDGFYKNSSYDKAKAFAYPPIDPNQVKFYKRVWREIDLHDPKNQTLNEPGATLADAVFEGVRTGRLTAYDAETTNPTGDNSFKKRLTYKQAVSKMRDSAMVDQFDKDGNKIGSKMVLNDFNPDKISRFRVKEDIFFDKKRALTVVRIIGIAPLMPLQASGQTVGYVPAFWLYFPQARNFFASRDVSDPDHNLYDLSMDDVFLQRRFTSTIVRASGSAGLTTQAAVVGTPTPGAVPADPNALAAAPTVDGKLVESKINDFKKNLWDYQTNNGGNAATIANSQANNFEDVKKPKKSKVVKPTTTAKADDSTKSSKKKQSS